MPVKFRRLQCCLHVARMKGKTVTGCLWEDVLEYRQLISYLELHTLRILYVMTGSVMWLHKQRTATLACAGVPEVAKCCHSGTS